ncbi:citrate-Mg2+:H+ or citrate-Ca2+:H+ symporter, CitMHS family [Algoriphagus alkaliphilus]|uniref:Citrate-Mg2+:H+ or citrate-Ca2+:H+ symporter, CitMHS family n=1 Tax=Algoriphagus alkaliphilus TaxID=279824 RepID=A0A1G5Y108_9BACT|nr:citrate:proton symporter [Algoriphagus alkaliphilus]SDA76150.1 citrate-Mg2+:H+ or citrate-Ca2+:H+ symporter, CitMHS family [Algoriphagus alkaliphilus]
MLATLGLVTILLLLYLVITKKASPVIALILVPILTGIAAGKVIELPVMIGDGIQSIAPTGVMFVFAILFFGILLDAGTFRPIIHHLLKIAGNDPIKIALSTAILAMLVHLDGSGAVTFLVVVPAMVPVYDQLGMKRLNLACIVALAAGTMNILPWGGPTIRAATALNVSVTELFNPIFIPFLFGLATVLLIAFFLGKSEKNRIGAAVLPVDKVGLQLSNDLEMPKLFWINIFLILLAITVLILGWAPPYVIFMVAFAIAMLINFPKIEDQKTRIDAHAKEAMLMASILFAAGCFTGIIKGTGMMDAMAAKVETLMPAQLGAQLPLITGLLAMPASMLFDPDSFYFGILPLLASTAGHFQVSALEVGQAAIMGQMTTGFPVSPLTGATFLLIGLAGVDLGDHQKKTIPLAFLVTLVILTVSIIMGIISV